MKTIILLTLILLSVAQAEAYKPFLQNISDIEAPIVPKTLSSVRVNPDFLNDERFVNQVRSYIRNYLTSKGLENLETNTPEYGVQFLWTPFAAVEHERNLIVILKLMDPSTGQAFETGEFVSVEAVLIKKRDELFEMKMFEECYKAPKAIIARLPYRNKTEEAYFVEFKGLSALWAMRASILKVKYDGFTGFVVSGKAPFDPTLNRNWKVVDATYGKYHQNSAEALAIYSFHFDLDFNHYFADAVQQMTSEGTVGAQVAPWGQGFIGQILKIEF